MGIRIVSKGPKQSFRLSLPGILILLILLLFLPLILLLIIFTAIGLFIWNLVPGQHLQARAYTKIVLAVPTIFFAMRGLTVDVESEDLDIKINF